LSIPPLQPCDKFHRDMYVYEFDWAPDSNRLVITAAHGNGDNNWYIAGLFKLMQLPVR